MVATIYRDSLGIPQPSATVSQRGGKTYRVVTAQGDEVHTDPVRYVLESVAAPKRAWGSVADAKRDLEAEGWEVQQDTDGFGHPRLRATHRATAQLLSERQTASAAKWADAQPCYVRYGDLPPGGASYNYAASRPEPGVSVFRGLLLASGEAKAVPSSHVEEASLLSLAGRPLYVVDGREIGSGSDGEPLLADCRIIDRAK